MLYIVRRLLVTDDGRGKQRDLAWRARTVSCKVYVNSKLRLCMCVMYACYVLRFYLFVRGSAQYMFWTDRFLISPCIVTFALDETLRKC